MLSLETALSLQSKHLKLCGDEEKFDPTNHNVRSSSGHIKLGINDGMQFPFVNGAKSITIYS